MTAKTEIVHHALNLKYDDLSKSVVDAVKRSVIDTLAVTIAGSSALGVEALAKLIKRWGGRKESTILVYGGKVPAFAAALANSTMARALDLDDVHEPAAMHLSAAIVPSAFVISEYSKSIKAKAISGKDFIAAIALGSDLLCRLRLAGPGAANEGGWSSETPAPLAVAIMGSRILGFDEEQMLNSMGIAYSQCSGNIQAHTEGVLTVRLQQGFGSMHGVLSVVLAEEGFTGAKDILDGVYGYYSLYMRGECNHNILAKNLGTVFEITNVSIKPYPCCKYTHKAIAGAIQLAEENTINPDSIERIVIKTNSHGYSLCGEISKQVPKNVPDAQFSYYYTTAVAFVKRKVFIDDFTETAIRNDEVLTLAGKITVYIDPDKDKMPGVLCPIDIEIQTKDGSRFYKSVETVIGQPENPMSFSDLSKRLQECTAFSAMPLAHDSVNQIMMMIEHLEEVDDVTGILKWVI